MYFRLHKNLQDATAHPVLIAALHVHHLADRSPAGLIGLAFTWNDESGRFDIYLRTEENDKTDDVYIGNSLVGENVRFLLSCDKNRNRLLCEIDFSAGRLREFQENYFTPKGSKTYLEIDEAQSIREGGPKAFVFKSPRKKQAL